MIDLRKPDLRLIEVGTVVITSKGFEWELIERKAGKEAWLDRTSKLVWEDLEDDKTMTHYEAMEKYGDKLPSKEIFEQGEEHGMREVLPNMDHAFFSSSVVPGLSGYAYDFDGRNGLIVYGSRDVSGFLVARCVARR